jgi:hypothetical protein
MCFREITLVIGEEETGQSEVTLDDIGMVEMRHHEALE